MEQLVVEWKTLRERSVRQDTPYSATENRSSVFFFIEVAFCLNCVSDVVKVTTASIPTLIYYACKSCNSVTRDEDDEMK